MEFFRANNAVTGCRIRLSFDAKADTKNKGIFITFQKQTGPLKGNHPFKGGARKTVKLTPSEVGSVIHAIETKGNAFPNYDGSKFGAYHDSGDGNSSQIYFNAHQKGGFIITAVVAQEKFTAGFNGADSVLLREWLRWALVEVFKGTYSQQKKEAQEFAKRSASTQEAPPDLEAAVGSADDDIPF